MACSHTRQTGVEMAALTPSDMVKDKEYTNWVKVTLALYYMKSGLHNFIETEVNCLHQSLKEKIYGGQTVPLPHCSMCNTKLLKRDKNTRAWNCQNQCKSCCDDWLHELLKLHVNQKSETISWDKSDTPSWPSKPWECAKVFMPRGQLHSSVGPAECDATALMTLLANCTHFHQKLSPKGKGLTHTISIIRNNVMYAGEMKLSDADRKNCIQQIIQLLEDPVSLNSIEDCKAAVGNIYKIDNDSVDVFFNVDLQMIALKTAVNEVRQELGMQENRSLDTIASLKMEYRLLIKQLNESLQDVGKVQGDKMDTIENDVKAVNNRTNKALQQQEKLSKSMEIMSKSVDVHDERLALVQLNITKLQEVIGQRPKEYNCCGKEMPWDLTVKDLHEAWQSIESYLLEELAPKSLLTFFEKGNILSVEECKHMCQLKRSEVADKLLQRIKANLPDAFLCLLHALDETKQDVIMQGMSQRIKETLNPRPKTHNQEINGVRCKGPNDLLTLLGQVRPELMNVHEERLLINCKSAKLKFHGSTPADGNSFFHAVADQLSLMGHPIQSAPDLRRELVNFLCIHETLEGPDGVVDLKNSVEKEWTTYCNDMMRDSEWVDATAVFAMAHMLKKDIIVVTSSPGENDHFIQWIVGMPNFNDRPILLGHVYESHYESLQTHDDQKKSIPETDGQRQLKRMACYSLKLKLSKDGDPLYVTEMKATSHFNKGRIVLDDDIKSQCLDWKHGSVIVYLRPLGKHAKETLAFFCRHGGMTNFVLDLLKKKDIFSSLPEGEITIHIQVCCYDEDSSSEDPGVQYGDHTQIVEEEPLSQHDSSTVTDNPKVIEQNLLLLYGYITEEIEPLQFQDTFVRMGVWDKSFFEQLRKTPRRRARANQFLEEVMNKGNTALEALVHALKKSGNDDIADRLCRVRKISSEFMDEGQVDDSMIKVVKEDSTAQAQEDMLWSCHLTVAVKKNDVKPVMRDRPFCQQKAVSQDRWSLITAPDVLDEQKLPTAGVPE